MKGGEGFSGLFHRLIEPNMGGPFFRRQIFGDECPSQVGPCPPKRTDERQELVHDEFFDARRALFRPENLFFRRRREEHGQTGDIDAPLVHEVGRRDHIPLGLGHDLSLGVEDHAVVEHPEVGLVAGQPADVVEKFREETEIEEMSCGVGDSADIEIDGHPGVGLGRVIGSVRVVGVAIAEKVP